MDEVTPFVSGQTNDSRRRITEVAKSCLLFKGLDASSLRTVIDAMEKKEFAAGDKIIEQGAVGDYFYIVVNGSAEIVVAGKGKVMDAGPGSSFGELALMYDAPRAATVQATAPVVAWALDRMTFKKTVMGSAMLRRKRHEDFLKSIEILQGLDEYQRLTVADALQPRDFGEGEVILREGDKGDDFYIVEEGEVKVTKEGVEGEVSKRLSTGAYFGERALLTNDARAATVTSVTPTRCQVLDRSTFKRLLGPLEDIMRSRMETYDKFKGMVAGIKPSGKSDEIVYSDTESEGEGDDE